MSLLLVVRSVPGAELDGVVADASRVEDGLRVFSRGGLEVLRAAPEDTLVVRDLGRLSAPRAAADGPSIRFR